MNNVKPSLATIEAILEDAKAGRMFILVDDEDRENEGDLVIPAQKADADAVNFMATHGRGLICLALDKARVEALGLPLMAKHNQSRHETAFTVSIESREGVTTGISAADRAKTIQTAIDPTKGKRDIVSPGHIFPLEAREGGVLVRAGHTEAAVDIARMAGMQPAGVICEILNEDGTMARLPDLIPFAQKHGLNIATIADLIAYRRQHDCLVRKVAETPFRSKYGGEFQLMVYANTAEYAEHIALVKGEIKPDEPTYVRVHKFDILRDVLGDEDHRAVRQRSMDIIAEHGCGVVLIIREATADSLSTQMQARQQAETEGTTTPLDLREYGIGAQILRDLGVRDMVLLSNSGKHVVGLEGYGLHITGYKELI